MRIYLPSNKHQNDPVPRTVYLDLNHELIAPREESPGPNNVDIIYCKNAGREAVRLDDEYDTTYRLAYCSECNELFDPEALCPRITGVQQLEGIKIVTLVR